MWQLPRPNAESALEELEVALARADGTTEYRLCDAERVAVGAMYARYDELEGRPTPELLGPTLSAALTAAIYSAYSQVRKGGRLENLRNRLKIAADRCPFCGIGPVTDLDHYLPRSRFQALSIYSRNLIPACHECNSKKRTADGRRRLERFIHAYFDVLPEERFLVAVVSLLDRALLVDFRIERTPLLREELYERLQFQVTRLCLQDRYRAEVNVFLASQEVSFLEAFGAERDGDRLRDFLLRSAAALAGRFGLNDWRPALMRGLAGSPEFYSGGFVEVLSPPAEHALEPAI
jgi:hypothetical protein